MSYAASRPARTAGFTVILTPLEGARRCLMLSGGARVGIPQESIFMATVQQKDAQISAASAAGAPRAGTISRWEQRLQQAVIVLGRLGLGLLFLTQLGSKLPPTFGCGSNFAFTTADASGNLQRTQGLCDWIGVESVYANRDRPVLGVNIRPLAQLNGVFIDS